MSAPTTIYGRDLSATTHIRPGYYVADFELLAQAAFRRITTKRGQLEDDQDYGLAISDLLKSNVTEDDLLVIQDRIRDEIRKDERLEFVEVELSQTSTLPLEVSIQIKLSPKNGADGFVLVLRADEVTAERISLERLAA